MKRVEERNTPTTYEELLQICEQLQQQVERGVMRHQQLIKAKNELDDELERHLKLQKYSHQVLQADNVDELIQLTLETFADVFQQPKVAIYEYHKQENTIQLQGQLGFKKKELANQYTVVLNDVIVNGLINKETDNSDGLFSFLPLQQAMIGGFAPRQQGTVHPGLIVAGFSEAEQHFMPTINERLLPVFNSMVQKAGLHFIQQKTLEELKTEVAERVSYQHQLEKIKTDLEQRVEDRTKDLARNNKRLLKEIEERREVEQELRRSNAELEQFAYVASHDLKTPLRSIGSFAQLLDRRYGNTFEPVAKEYLDFILSSARQLDSVINDLLSYSQISNQKEEEGKIALNELIGNTLQQIRGMLNETNATVNYESLPTLLCKKVQMEHLFHNLITNAVKFRKPNVDPIVLISFEQKEQFLKFRVRDNGIGISMSFKNKIFELFQRLHTDKEYAGTGLGLSICRKIVYTIGGEIWFEPNTNGTDFFFTIPIDYLVE